MTRRLPLALVGGLAVALAARSTPLASRGAMRAPQSAPVFRSTTNLVQVDVIVHDDRDHFVGGLTADDLDVYEDGKLQHIQQLYLVRTDPATGVTTSDGMEASPSDLRSHRLFVLVFDERDLETSALQRIKAGAERFLVQQFREGDLGAVVASGQFYAGKLTQSRATLVAGVHAVRPAFDSRETRLRPFREFPRIPGEAEAVRVAEGDRFLIEDLGNQACGEDPAACGMDGGLQQVENKLQQKARIYLGQARDATRYTLEMVQMVVNAVAPLPGRKTVVLFSDGFFVEESRSLLQQLAGAAARAGATIYAVDGRGLGGRTAQPDVLTLARPLSGTLDTGDDGPAILADGTGGFVLHNMDEIPHALNLIAADTSNYYVVGYTPTNGVMDGKFRKITVTPKAAGLTVRARRGYVASPLPPRVSK
jgi:VWFA-related protein